MSTVIPQYPFDPTGLAETNKVVEVVAVKSRGILDHYYVVPRAAPFYAESAVLRLYPAGTNPNNPSQGIALVEGVHYNFGYRFSQASHTIGMPVYGAITFYDRTLEGQLRLEYQTLGGSWTLDDQTMGELLLNYIVNPRIAQWEQLVELPHQFPVVNHSFSIDDFVGMSEVVDELSDIERAILQSNAGGLTDHLADYNNPHRVTKAQVGLGLVDNYPSATLGEAQAGTANNRFMTPLRVRQAIDLIAGGALTAHMNDQANPHGVTKAHVGLGSVQNLGLSSEAEAEAGASNARYMTPLRVRQSIEAIVGNSFNAHADNVGNPHQVTKAQVGLSNVPNIGIAIDTAALQGLDDSGIITPRLLAMVISETVNADLVTHVNAIDNPHAVTKGQVGLGNVANYPPASEAEARDATSSDRYMTPLAVRHAINELAGDQSSTHIQDLGNPHQVTKSQVGLSNVQDYGIATESAAVTGTSNNSYMTPLRTKQAVIEHAAVLVDEHEDLRNNPHAVTKVQVGLGQVDNYPTASSAEAKAAVATDRFMTPQGVREAIIELVGDQSNAHSGDRNNPHQVTASQVGLGNVGNFAVATEAEASSTTVNNKYMTPLRTYQAIVSHAGDAIGSHTDDMDNPHQVTAGQVGAYSKSETMGLLEGKLGVDDTAANSTAVYGMNQGDLEAWIATLTATDSHKLEGLSVLELTSNILEGKAADSTLFDGRTYNSLLTELGETLDASSIQYEVPAIMSLPNSVGAQTVPPTHWVKIGEFFTSQINQTADLALLINGYRDDESLTSSQSSVLVAISGFVGRSDESAVDGTMIISSSLVQALTPGDDNITVGYVTSGINSDSKAELYIKMAGSRTKMTITELSSRLFVPADIAIPEEIADLVTVEPVGIVYPETISGVRGLEEHLESTDNPHQVTKSQVGLGSVQNYAVASSAEALGGTLNNRYMTPLRVMEVVNQLAGGAISDHVADANNPHSVTKSQVGLGSVQNYGMATQAEAQGGTNNAKYMTPLRTKEAIESLAGGAITSHTGNTSNPHSVTKAQVSLGNVQNYGVANKAEAEAGTASDKYMTPLRVKEAIDALASGAIGSHTNNTSNPHSVTKMQVGLGKVQDYGVATEANAVAGTDNNSYMTPLRTKEAIDALAGGAITSHTGNTSNPHGVTKAQVGLGSVGNYGMATDANAIAGTATNLYMSPKSSAALVDEKMTELCDELIQAIDDAIAELG